MTRFMNRFRREESGAITVDWVVLTAGIIGMSLVLVYGIVAAATDPAEGLGAALTEMK